MTPRQKRDVDRVLDIAVDAVFAEWGRPAFGKLGTRLQKALLAEGFLYLLAQQSEQVEAETVRVLVNAAWDRVAAFEATN